MPLQTQKLEKEQVSTEIDLKSLVGDLSKDQSVREVFLQAALDKMSERLDQGRGVDGKLHKYSKSYKESASFEIFGKSSTVNMRLSGDMLSAITELDSKKPTNITIGIDDELEAAKAYAHMTGFKGHPTLSGKVDERLWFGWKDSELIAIAEDIKPNLDSSFSLSDEIVLGLLARLVG